MGGSVRILWGLVVVLGLFNASCAREPAGTTAPVGSAGTAPDTAPEPPASAQAGKRSDLVSPGISDFVRAQPGQVVIHLSDGAGLSETLAAIVGESGQIVSLGLGDLPADLASASVDVVFADFSYGDLGSSDTDRRHWLDDVYRLLKPDGTLIVTAESAWKDSESDTSDSDGRVDERLVYDEVTAAGFDVIEQTSPRDLSSGSGHSTGGVNGGADARVLVKFRKPPPPPDFGR